MAMTKLRNVDLRRRARAASWIVLIAVAFLAPARGDETPALSGMRFLDNGQIRLGVDLDRGGAITYLSRSGQAQNLINSFDLGRQIQMSFYSGPIPYRPHGKEPADVWRGLGWNPIQTGDHYKHPSKVTAFHSDGTSLTVQCIPMQWPLNNEPADCAFECTLSLDHNTVRADCRMIANREDLTQYPARFQELPAIYTNGPWWRLMTYIGDRPFTSGALSQMPAKMPWSMWKSSESWAALMDDHDFGLGVWEPGVHEFGGGFAGEHGAGGTADGPTGYIAPVQAEIIDHNIDYQYQYVLILGSLGDIRKYVYDHARRPAPPRYVFAHDRQHWTYHDLLDTGWPIKVELDLSVNGKDPYLCGPADFWFAADAPVARIEAAFDQTRNAARLRWATSDDDRFSEEKMISFPVIPDGAFHVYQVDLSKQDTYRGAIARLRLDPIPIAGQHAHIRIKSITFTGK